METDKGKELKKYYSSIFKRYDLVNRLFTIGQDQKWRNYTIQKCLELNPRNILDLCCGTGDMALMIAKNTKKDVLITGYDFNPEMLNTARKKAEKIQQDINFIEGDAGVMPFPENTFDAITIGFGFRNLTYGNSACDKNIREISRVLKPNGKFYILESGVPANRLVKLMYNLYLYVILVPLGSLISGNFKAYRYLAKSSSEFYSNEQLKALLSDYGFKFNQLKKFFPGAADLFIFEKIKHF